MVSNRPLSAYSRDRASLVVAIKIVADPLDEFAGPDVRHDSMAGLEAIPEVPRLLGDKKWSQTCPLVSRTLLAQPPARDVAVEGNPHLEGR